MPTHKTLEIGAARQDIHAQRFAPHWALQPTRVPNEERFPGDCCM